MKRLFVATIAVAVVAAAIAAWGLAAPTSSARDAAPAADVVKKPNLPPLPADL